ncbi:unnamed protein product, partial [Mesorhabditis belari]|uniref:Uncharacterized protein n=1 Tax=Mesorhabditis belari TaxID=2138241 RepID=A0AAF3ET19_9BILA
MEPILKQSSGGNDIIKEHYLGVLYAKQAAQRLDRSQCRIYYQRPIDGLIHIFHFPLVKTGSMWRIKYGESRVHEYSSLERLLSEKDVYFYLSITEPGMPMEAFRVNRRPKIVVEKEPNERHDEEDGDI